ncbi:hypothetical protein ACFYPF_28995, partial [Micromonospora sp. NPDC005223]|uniref:hypothetical protein n=1 Tax=unclassified Micromonospora TaxID=2617518 RepID=UPI00341115C6
MPVEEVLPLRGGGQGELVAVPTDVVAVPTAGEGRSYAASSGRGGWVFEASIEVSGDVAFEAAF